MPSSKREDQQVRLSNAEARVQRREQEIKRRQDEISAGLRELSALEERAKELGRKIAQLEDKRRIQASFLPKEKCSLLNELGAIRDETEVPEHLKALWREHQKFLDLN